MAHTWRALSGDRLQGRTRAYGYPSGYRDHLVRAFRSEAADIRCKSCRTVGLQSNNYGQQFEINRRGIAKWPTASRVTLAILRAEIVGIGTEGPCVRVETGS